MKPQHLNSEEFSSYSEDGQHYRQGRLAEGGFSAQFEESTGQRCSLDQLLITNPPSTFFAKANGKSMQGAGIFDGDILIIDRSLDAKDGNIVICTFDGELLVKRIRKSIRDGYLSITLESEHRDYRSFSR